MSLTDAPLDRAQVLGLPSPVRRRRGMRLLLIAMASASLTLAAIFGKHGALEVVRYAAERDRLRAEIAAMEQQVQAQERELKALQADPKALERIAREDLS